MTGCGYGCLSRHHLRTSASLVLAFIIPLNSEADVKFELQNSWRKVCLVVKYLFGHAERHSFSCHRIGTYIQVSRIYLQVISVSEPNFTISAPALQQHFVSWDLLLDGLHLNSMLYCLPPASIFQRLLQLLFATIRCQAVTYVKSVIPMQPDPWTSNALTFHPSVRSAGVLPATLEQTMTRRGARNMSIKCQVLMELSMVEDVAELKC